jgi:hypothetical protein
MPPCDQPDCPARCGSDVAFGSLRCRLSELVTAVDTTAELAPMRGDLDRHLGKARSLFDKAEARCQVAKRGPAKRNLRLVRRRLGKVGKTLRRSLSQRAISSAVTDPIARSAAAIAADVRILSSGLGCR